MAAIDSREGDDDVAVAGVVPSSTATRAREASDLLDHCRDALVAPGLSCLPCVHCSGGPIQSAIAWLLPWHVPQRCRKLGFWLTFREWQAGAREAERCWGTVRRAHLSCAHPDVFNLAPGRWDDGSASDAVADGQDCQAGAGSVTQGPFRGRSVTVPVSASAATTRPAHRSLTAPVPPGNFAVAPLGRSFLTLPQTRSAGRMIHKSGNCSEMPIRDLRTAVRVGEAVGSAGAWIGSSARQTDRNGRAGVTRQPVSSARRSEARRPP